MSYPLSSARGAVTGSSPESNTTHGTTVVHNSGCCGKDTHLFVSALRLCDGAVIVVPDGNLPGQALVDGRQSLRDDVEVVLDSLLLLLLQQDLPVELVSLRTQVLDALGEE